MAKVLLLTKLAVKIPIWFGLLFPRHRDAATDTTVMIDQITHAFLDCFSNHTFAGRIFLQNKQIAPSLGSGWQAIQGQLPSL